jgi:hypothetical protein
MVRPFPGHVSARQPASLVVHERDETLERLGQAPSQATGSCVGFTIRLGNPRNSKPMGGAPCPAASTSGFFFAYVPFLGLTRRIGVVKDGTSQSVEVKPNGGPTPQSLFLFREAS